MHSLSAKAISHQSRIIPKDFAVFSAPIVSEQADAAQGIPRECETLAGYLARLFAASSRYLAASPVGSLQTDGNNSIGA
jgi:hypothetical protein